MATAGVAIRHDAGFDPSRPAGPQSANVPLSDGPVALDGRRITTTVDVVQPDA